MEQKHADFLEKSRSVFIDAPGITLLDIEKKIKAEPESTRKRDCLSAVSAIKDVSGSSTPCSIRFMAAMRSIVASKSNPWNMPQRICSRCASSRSPV